MVASNHEVRRVDEETWPRLPLADWQATHDTLHMWMQMVGKTRLAPSPKQNHWWHVPLYVSSRGLTTTTIDWPDEGRTRPAGAYYSRELGEFILPYERVRSASSPDEMVLEFFQSAYEAGADLARWDCAALDRPPAEWG